jgi:SulP family sulfate permease
MILVTVITVAIDLLVAVAAGLLIAIFLFVRDETRQNVVRRKYRGNEHGSRRVRLEFEREVLQRHGDEIICYELKGSIFFGTADKLIQDIEKELPTGSYVILDFQRVDNLDITGAQLLRELLDRVEDHQKQLIVCSIDESSDPKKQRIAQLLQDTEIVQRLEKERLFPDMDRAQEWAEDQVLHKYQTEVTQFHRAMMLHELSIFREFTDDELEYLGCLIGDRRYQEGEAIIRTGEKTQELFLILSGNVHITKDLSEGARQQRLVTFGAGSFFGDLAFIDGRPRSANAVAASACHLIIFPRPILFKLMDDRPKIAMKIVLALSREISDRFRRLSKELQIMEEL